MMTIGWTVVLQACLVGAGDETYAAARKATLDSGKPMVVMVGATWCPACVKLKERILPEVRQKAMFPKVHFAAVDIDEEKEVGKQLAKGGSIPQLVLFRRTADGWRSRRLIGAHDAEAVDEFLAEGIAAAEADKKKSPAKTDAAPKEATAAAERPSDSETPDENDSPPG